MISSSKAACHFYHAFYDWTRLTTPTQISCERQRSRALFAASCLGRSFSTSHIITIHKGAGRCGLQRATGKARQSTSALGREANDSETPLSKSTARLGASTSNINIHPDLSSHMRQLMRRVPHPITVITSSTPITDHGSPESAFRGMTVSSFNSVAIEPVPLVSFNVRVPSATHSAMTSSADEGVFLAHLLNANPIGAHIANTFAKGSNRDGEAFEELATSVFAREDQVQIFAGAGTRGAPLIAGHGVMQILRCKLVPGKEIDIGDHKVIIAEVLGMVSQSGRKKQGSEKQCGLVYSDQRYRSVGSAIQIESRTSRPEDEIASQAEKGVRQTAGLNVRRGDEQA